MAIPNEKYREVIFLLLYSKTLAAPQMSETAEMIMEQLKVTKATLKKGELEVDNLIQNLSQIDEQIQSVTRSYDFDRIQSIEKTALRLGVFEMLFAKTVPPKVAISEAIRLSKKFGTKASISFVNAILDALYKTSLGSKIDTNDLHKTLEDIY